MIALREEGLEVPRDVLVTGFDDCQVAYLCGPGITSVRQDVEQMAHLAAELLLGMIEGLDFERQRFAVPHRASMAQRQQWAEFSVDAFLRAFSANATPAVSLSPVSKT